MKLGIMDEELKAPYMFLGMWIRPRYALDTPQICPGAYPERGKNRLRAPRLKKNSSDWTTTATNRMHINDLEVYGKKCYYFWFHSEVKFRCIFDVLLDLVILPYFNAISTGFYAVKCFINI